MEQISAILAAEGIETESLEPMHETDRGAVWCLAGPGGEAAIQMWHRLRGLVDRTGHWPVILGSDEDLPRVEEMSELNEAPTSSILAAAEAQSGGEALTTLAAAHAAEMAAYGGDVAPEVGNWPEGNCANDRFVTPFEILSGQPHTRVWFALVPTTRPWEVPAFLALGGWNDCPPAEIHVAVLRDWHEQYGAEIVAATADVIECHVIRPPTDQTAALALAREQYAYCYDIVEQGAETLSNLAAALLEGSAWYFWWD